MAAAARTDSVSPSLDRPLLRGVLHLGAAGAAAAGIVLLVLLAGSARAYVGGTVFASSLVLLYTTSGVYHTITWKPAARRLLKRLDHAMIFVLIAGTYTPFCLLSRNDAWGITMLAVVWGISGAGILMKLLWPDAPRPLSVAAYVAVGWLALVAAAPLLDWLAGPPLALLVLGGVLYTAGGLVDALKRPDPLPRVFGYHEVFHALVVAGSAVHFSVVAVYLLPA
ncbi:MAG TPA: hemolysin III family protein [Dehalococcoidia bacterium]|nr:hemolysin III family protein [Dehalococcoidia bacterium]